MEMHGYLFALENYTQSKRNTLCEEICQKKSTKASTIEKKGCV